MKDELKSSSALSLQKKVITSLVPIYLTYCEFSCKRNLEVFILMPYGQNGKVSLKCFETLRENKLDIFHHLEESLERSLGNI